MFYRFDGKSTPTKTIRRKLGNWSMNLARSLGFMTGSPIIEVANAGGGFNFILRILDLQAGEF